MRPPRQVRSPDFLKVPRNVRELRGVTWAAKVAACAIRYRQQDTASVSGEAVGSAALAVELGVSQNTVLRAVSEAAAKGLLKILNPKAPSGSARVYDARPMDALESAPRSEALCGPKRPKPCGQSTARSEAAKRPKVCGASAPRSEAPPHEGRREEHQEGGEEGAPLSPEHATDTANTADGDDARLLALWQAARGRKASDGERGKFLEAVREAREAGATGALIAHHVRDRAGGAAWDGPNAARDTARALLADWHSMVGENPARKTLVGVLTDLDFTARYERGEALTRDGQPVEPDAMGLNRCRRARAFSGKHAETLRAAATWPDAEPARATG